MLPDAPEKPWTFVEKLAFRWSFVLLPLLMISFDVFFPSREGYFLTALFVKLAAWTGHTFFHFSSSVMYAISSDSVGFYMHALNILALSFLIAALWSALDKKRDAYPRMQYWLFVVVRYYLFILLLTYGFNKIFKWQFYLPEPNTLYTNTGQLPRDFLYWTSMSSSWSYVVFSGLIEIIPAILLLFRRTYVAGALIALLVFTNVLMVNIGFNISVKLFSAFLILLCLVLLAPERKKLFAFFFRNTFVAVKKHSPVYATKTKSRIYSGLKIFVVLMCVSLPLSTYVLTGNYNDDKQERPPLHGAYEVTLFVKNGDTLIPLTTDTTRWKRFFVHRRGYGIIQSMNEEMTSYPLYVDTTRRQLIFEEEAENATHQYLDYKMNDSTLIVDGIFRKDMLHLELRKIDLQKLPLLKDDFQWMWEE